jgi:prepilin-type N-terminal cleavage/methylation domain-containing protein
MGLRFRTRGFTLVEILVVLVIVGILLAMTMALTRGISAAQKRSLTATRLANVDAALVQFVMQQKRLPCPADGRKDATDPLVGSEGPGGGAGGCTALQHGVVPWRAIGLSETDASDGWDRRFTYRLDPALAALNGMDMYWCDPAGTETSPPAPAAPRACNAACSSTPATAISFCTQPGDFLKNRGLTVRHKNVPPTVTLMDPTSAPNSGAAYVVISAGESGGGAYLSSGQISTGLVGEGAGEALNRADAPFVSNIATYFVDDSVSEGLDHFDDLLSRPSVLAVISKAALGPRSH